MAYCKNHPNAIAVGRCAGCAEEFCQNCLVDVSGQKYCAACKVMALQGKTPGAVIEYQERQSLPNPLAKEALTYAIVGIFCFGFILGPVAIYKAVKAKQAIAADPRLGGSGQATAAMIIAIIATILNCLGLALKISSMK